MLSYQHSYHAGNFADVIKHLILTRIINYLTLKEKPIFYLETHAGRGVYDFNDPLASKTLEFQKGISLVWKNKNRAPALFSSYLEAIESLNISNSLRFYPGSPYLTIQALRKQDRYVACELHPNEFSFLETLPKNGNRVFFSNTDGFDSLKALLPPPERRGLIFIDPSFEIKTEYKVIPTLINAAYKRFSNGVFCLWYPIINTFYSSQLHRGLKMITMDSLNIEFHLNEKSPKGLQGTGLWIINPPYTLAKELKIGLDFLKTLFNPDYSFYRISQ